jgi:hypothetical protein
MRDEISKKLWRLLFGSDGGRRIPTRNCVVVRLPFAGAEWFEQQKGTRHPKLNDTMPMMGVVQCTILSELYRFHTNLQRWCGSGK